jgi:hypothetical protein
MSDRIVVLLLAVLLSACAAQSPPRTDPLADLVGKARIVDSPASTVTEAKTKTLALIVSTSSETQIKHREETDTKYLEGYVKVYQSGSYNTVKSMQQSVGPRKLIDTVVSELRQRFKAVTVVADLAEFREGKQDVAAVVDVGMEYSTSSGFASSSGAYTTDVSIIVFDRQIRKIGTAIGKATESAERSGTEENVKAFLLVFADTPPEEQIRPFINAEQKSRTSAFRLLNSSLDKLVQK